MSIRIKEKDLMNIDKTGVYLITNSLNNKKYVGKTGVNFRNRWHNYEKDFRNNIHDNYAIFRAFRKYGIDNFEFSILEIIEPMEDINKLNSILNFWERYWINYYNSFNNGYNMTKGGDGLLGYKFSEEDKMKMSQSRKGENNSFYGRHHTEETKRKLREKVLGNKSWCKGLTKETDERVMRISEYFSKNNPSKRPEVRKKISKALKNKFIGENNPNYGNTGESNIVTKGYHVGKHIKTGEYIVLCGSKDIVDNGFTSSGVCCCESGKYKQHHGYKFELITSKEELLLMGLDYPYDHNKRE